MSSNTTVFELVTRLVNGTSRPIEDGTVMVDKSYIYLGRHGNWKYSWKTVQDVEIRQGGLTIVTPSQTINCHNAQHDPSFRVLAKFVEKRWNKLLQKKLAEQERERPIERQRKKPRMTYGRRSSSKKTKRYSSKFDMARPVDYFSSDEEDDKQEEDTTFSQATLKDRLQERQEEASVGQEDEETRSELDSDKEDARPRNKGRLQRARQDKDESSDDEGMFDSNVATTPAAKRIVSPATDPDGGKQEKKPAAAAKPTDGNSTITKFFPSTTTAKASPHKKTSTPLSSPARTKTSTPLSSLPPIKTLSSPARTKKTPFKKTGTPSPALTKASPLRPTKAPETPPSIHKRSLEPNTAWLNQPPTSARSALNRKRPPPNEGVDTESVTQRLSSRFFELKPPAVERDSMEDITETPPRTPMKEEAPPHSNSRRNRRFRGKWIARRSFDTPAKTDSADAALAITTTAPPRSAYNKRYRNYKVQRPVLTLSSVWKGLCNLGNTCYLNSSLQMLYSVQGFMPALAKLVGSKGGPLASEVVSVWDALKDTKSYGAANPKALKKEVDKLTDKFHGYEQRDAHEFLSDLVDQVHDEAELDNKENLLPTDEYFRMNVQVCLTCDSCGYNRAKEEMYRHLSLDIDEDDDTGAWSIQRGLEKFFEPEVRELRCEKCKEGATATQTLRILSGPKALLLHLKRFVLVEVPVAKKSESDEDKENDNDENKENAASEKTEETKPEGNDEQAEKTKRPPAVEMTFRKNKDPVTINEKLSLGPIVGPKEEPTKPSFTSKYDLQSVVHHIGSTASSGHYTADCIRQDEKGNDVWVSFDDGMTSLTNADQVVRSKKSRRSTYMLLYTLQE